MFRINYLSLIDPDGEVYTYTFSDGINYFQGKNDTGKTEFYFFMDFMFGSSDKLDHKNWYKGTLSYGKMSFEVDCIEYVIKRSLDGKENYLYYKDEENDTKLSREEYVERLNSIFTKNELQLKKMREFTQENMTFRTFTLFNFLGEKRLGIIQDFFDKTSQINYAIKLPTILNYVFNKNFEEISIKQKQLDELQKKLKQYESETTKFLFIKEQIDGSLIKLDIPLFFNGKNAKKIRDSVDKLKLMKNETKPQNSITDLELAYNKISEQIKIYEQQTRDVKSFKMSDKNRKKMLKTLGEVIKENYEFAYLIEPLSEILDDIDSSISFNDYLTKDETIKSLKNQKLLIKKEIESANSKFKLYELNDKKKAMAIIDECLSIDAVSHDEEIKDLKREISSLKEDIKRLQNSDDVKKIDKMSDFITDLYSSASNVSSVVEKDTKRDGFKIKYLKKGNILQPIINDSENGNENFYIGSMARHTLIQLCGYLGFLDVLVNDESIPMIPFLVIDHISKPFDKTNCNAIGAIFEEAARKMGKTKIQIFIFDDESPIELSLKYGKWNMLVEDGKSGFNPFFYSEEIDTQE